MHGRHYHVDEAFDLFIMATHAMNKRFIIEIGSGLSTKMLARISSIYASLFYSIDIDHMCDFLMPVNVYYLTGWSITKKDLTDVYNGDFEKSGYLNGLPEDPILFEDQEMQGETDLLRKCVREVNQLPDFVFIDSGEYSSYPEWLIVKDLIDKNGIICVHDIYYPKSIKGYRILKDIEESKDWEIVEKTNSAQGLLVARKKD